MTTVKSDGSNSEKNIWTGGCHCKNIRLEFFSCKNPQDLWLRKCPCNFCTKQGNHNVADPEGKLRLMIDDSNKVIYYQMGHKTSNRLICQVCGVYVGGFMIHEGQSLCVLNANVLEERNVFSDPTPINVSHQTPKERIAGRLDRWMPFEIS